MKTILLVLTILISHQNIFSQISGSPLKVSGNLIKDNNNNTFILKTINLNDYMECTYNNWGRYFGQNFQSITSWLHTADDYLRIKKLGFNSVRLNICPAHLDSIPNLQRIKDNINWARNENLYIILAYFAPPGSDSLNGYYQEKNFYINESNKNKFRHQWSQILHLCKDSNYSHVLYEFLNEPQIGYIENESIPSLSAYWKRSMYKDLMNNLLDTLNHIGDGNRVVIIDGLNYAKPDYKGFKYLKSTINHSNIIYSFHYYMDDFALRGCNWNLNNPYRNYTGYSETNTPWDTVSFNFTTTDLQNVLQPWIAVAPHDQKGTYKIKYLEIKENSTNNVKLSLDLTNNSILTDIYGKYILYSGRKFYIGYGGAWGSAINSNMYITNNSSLAISNTVKQDTGVSISEANWAAVSYSNESYNNPFTLSPLQTYTFKIVMNGDTLGDNGGFVIEFKNNNNSAVHRVEILNLTYGISPNIEKILSSHTDRIDAAFIIMNQISNEFNVPIFLGEFGIPIEQREPNTYKYFRTIMNNVNKYNFSWAYYNYREPAENDRLSTSNFITYGLFSGRDQLTPTATVNKIVGGINSGITSNILGTPFLYYYNKSLIDTLTRILGGTFVIPKQLNLTSFIQGFYNQVSNSMVQDTIKIILRNTVSPFIIIDSAKAIVNNSGSSTYSFSNASNGINYYIVAKHRNSLETWSKTGQQFSSGYLSYDFSNNITKAYGDNIVQIDSSPIRYGNYSGDVNQDGNINLTDIIQINNDAVSFKTGYVSSDTNGDNLVSLADILICYNNSIEFKNVIRP